MEPNREYQRMRATVQLKSGSAPSCSWAQAAKRSAARSSASSREGLRHSSPLDEALRTLLASQHAIKSNLLKRSLEFVSYVETSGLDLDKNRPREACALRTGGGGLGEEKTGR